MGHGLHWKHLGMLLDNLEAIHKTGYVHRDIRLPNILESRTLSNKLFISDFGFITLNEDFVEYQGTIETASQWVLSLFSS